ncbi:MAG: class I SAM-dependent methyltransferase [Thermoanaerobaculia bacterium]|nr:class I SAM-dependent methyltransferase [Thermoanaerobaculia bacterium]
MVVEVGVFEGVTSRWLADAIGPEGRLILVDPFVPALRVERLFGFSGARTIARRTVSGAPSVVDWVRSTSLAAAGEVRTPEGADLVFLDARHEYEAVAEDLRSWSPHVSGEGVIAVHDSRPCPSRPELSPESGGCRAVTEFLGAGLWRLLAEVESLAVITRVEPHPLRKVRVLSGA